MWSVPWRVSLGLSCQHQFVTEEFVTSYFRSLSCDGNCSNIRRSCLCPLKGNKTNVKNNPQINHLFQFISMIIKKRKQVELYYINRPVYNLTASTLYVWTYYYSALYVVQLSCTSCCIYIYSSCNVLLELSTFHEDSADSAVIYFLRFYLTSCSQC